MPATASADTEQLVVLLEAKINQFEKNFAKANKVANDNWRKIENRGKQASTRIETSMSKAVTSIANSFRNLGATMLASFGSVEGIRAISAAAQQFTNLQNALKVAGLSGDELKNTFSELFKIAQQNGTPIASLVKLYSQATTAQKELNASSADLIKFTNGISLALRVSGASQEAQEGALEQLSQLLGDGKVQAQEYNSIIDGARPILQAVAAGLKETGGSVGRLTALVKDGKVSSEAFFRAFIAGTPTLVDMAGKMDGTVSQAMTRIQNAFIGLVGALDETSGASDNAAKHLDSVASAIQKMPDYIKAASQGLSELQSWLGRVGNSPIWDKINAFFGVDKEAAQRRFNALVGQTDTNTPATTPATAPAAKPVIKPVSLADFKLPGAKTGKSAADTRKEQVEDYIKQLDKSTRVLQAQFDTLGKSNAERAKAIELARIGTVTDAGQLKRIEDAVDANEKLRKKIEQVKEAQEGLRDAAKFAGEAITDSLADLIVDGDDASDVVENLAKQLAKAALQAALIGSGPLASVFGTKPASGGLGVGGLFGALLGAFSFADGGVMTPRGPLPLRRYASGGVANSPQLALYGEGKNPEAYVPLPDGRTIPVKITAPTISAPTSTVNHAPTIVSAPQITVNVEGGSRGPEADNELAAKIGQQLHGVAKKVVTDEISRQMRPGGLIASGRR